jgi:hypothetical protein
MESGNWVSPRPSCMYHLASGLWCWLVLMLLVVMLQRMETCATGGVGPSSPLNKLVFSLPDLVVGGVRWLILLPPLVSRIRGPWSGALPLAMWQGCCCFSQELTSRGLAPARSILHLLPLVKRRPSSSNSVRCASSWLQVVVEDLRHRR